MPFFLKPTKTFIKLPPAKYFITHTLPPCLLFFVKERYRISKSTHIYFIQIYIEFKYYIQYAHLIQIGKILLFLNGKRYVYILTGHIITSIIQPMPSHPCLLLAVELQWQRPPVSELYIYIVQILKKTVIVYSGDEDKWVSRILTTPGSNCIYFVGRSVCYTIPGVADLPGFTTWHR